MREGVIEGGKGGRKSGKKISEVGRDGRGRVGEREYGTRKKKDMKEQGRRGVDGRRKEYIVGKPTTPEWLRYNGDAQTTFPLIL